MENNQIWQEQISEINHLLELKDKVPTVVVQSPRRKGFFERLSNNESLRKNATVRFLLRIKRRLGIKLY